MTLLIPMGIGGVDYGWRIITAILILLVIVYFSYRQTIAAYPGAAGATRSRRRIWERSGAAGGRGPDDRLHSDGSGGNLGGCDGADFGGARPGFTITRLADLPGHSC